MTLVGADIEQISRFTRILARSPGFIKRVFTETERTYCNGKGRPAQHYAARFCAKEALLKALGVTLSYQEIEVVSDNTARPIIRVCGKAAELVAGRTIQVTLSHSGNYAIATVLVED